jgi:DNA-binding XRE family transcriptional regulator
MKTTHQEMQPIHAAGYIAMCNLAKQGKGRKTLNVSTLTLRQMLEAYEDMLDIIAYDEAKKNQPSVEYFPKALVDRLITGENRLRVYREYRKLTQQALSTASGVSRDMIAMIETDKKTGSVATNKKLAQALKVDLEDLV